MGPPYAKDFTKWNRPCTQVITYYQNEAALVEITLTFHLLERKLGTSIEGKRLPITFTFNRIRIFHFQRNFFFMSRNFNLSLRPPNPFLKTIDYELDF